MLKKCPELRMNRLYTIGDGSCFLHAILQCFSKEYSSYDTTGKIEFVKRVRYYLSECLEENDCEIYNRLSREEIREIAKAIPGLRLENMKRYLNSRQWLNIFFLELISDIFDLDIYIVDSHTKDLYKTGDKEIYYKGRDSVILYYIRDAHFESISVTTEQGEQTMFSHDSYVIQTLYNIL